MNHLENCKFKEKLMQEKRKQHISASLWIAEQLSNPIDPEAKDTISHTKEDIEVEFTDVDMIEVSEWTEQCIVLAKKETKRYGREVSIELVESERVVYKFKSNKIPQISLGGASVAILDSSQTHWYQIILILLVDNEKEEEKILSNIKVSRVASKEKDDLLGFNAEDLGLVIKAWVHLGGDLGDLEGLQSK